MMLDGPPEITPKTCGELLELVARRPPPWTLCLDEFPYLTEVDRSLPSRLQRWLIDASNDVVGLADALYFGFAPFMEFEPQRLLRDEQINGASALAVLEAVGRGAHRPSEVAARLGVPQTNLSRLFGQLIDASILAREVPWGESSRTTKRVLYRVADPATRFWFGVYSAHRSRWSSYSLAARRKLIHEHASTVFEDHCRARFPGAQRYWEAGLELELVAPDPEDAEGLVVAEVKWKRLSASERKSIAAQLREKWSRSTIGRRGQRARFVVLDATSIAESPRREK